MPYDLRRESWIPWRRANGAVRWGAPAALVEHIASIDDAVVGISGPRPDFDGALQEFLIGLLSAALRPTDERAWRKLWNAPPDVATLQAAFDALPPAFDLDGDGPRFFQDRSESDFGDVELGAPDQLLIDTPGDQGVRLNKDLFVKRARVERLSRPAAAMALITLQTYAPAGGQGHRTSLRGGGPLTTLVDPRVDAAGRPRAELQSLWAKLWANVETTEQWKQRTPDGAPFGDADRFPWLLPTRTSNGKAGGRATTAAEAHALQAYFGLPRRIRLDFDGPGRCDLTGREDERTVVGFRMRNYGVQYTDWRHPLSPHYRQKVGEPWLPVHGQPRGLGWRDWVSLALSVPDRRAARAGGRGRRVQPTWHGPRTPHSAPARVRVRHGQHESAWMDRGGPSRARRAGRPTAGVAAADRARARRRDRAGRQRAAARREDRPVPESRRGARRPRRVSRRTVGRDGAVVLHAHGRPRAGRARPGRRGRTRGRTPSRVRRRAARSCARCVRPLVSIGGDPARRAPPPGHRAPRPPPRATRALTVRREDLRSVRRPLPGGGRAQRKATQRASTKPAMPAKLTEKLSS